MVQIIALMLQRYLIILITVISITGTEANVEVVDLPTKTMLINDICKMSNLGQTNGVEAYHSVANHLPPKCTNSLIKE